jgi:hypothetical protein
VTTSTQSPSPHRWFRITAFILLTLFLFFLFAWLFINWAGARRWAAVQADITSQGETFDIRKIGPDPIPDAQNFCAIPPLIGLASIPASDSDTSPQGQRRLRLMRAGLEPATEAERLAWTSARDAAARKSPPRTRYPLTNYSGRPRFNAASNGVQVDLAAWSQWLRENGPYPPVPDSGNPQRDITTLLSRNDPLVSELALGLSRPLSQWTPAWNTLVVPGHENELSTPHLIVSTELSNMLALRAIAAAALGDAPRAHQSLAIAVRLAQADTGVPYIIGTLVADGDAGRITDVVWELCNAHCGTPGDFHGLQSALTGMDLGKSLLEGERGEMIFGANFTESLKTRHPRLFFMPQYFGYLAYAPPGFVDASAASVAQCHFDYFLKPLRDGGFREMLARQDDFDALTAECKAQWYFHLEDMVALIAIPSIEGVATRTIYMQSLLNQSIAACALERYRIEHGAYPDTLAQANHPGEPPIPNDILTGKPMGYRKTPNGRYALWSISLNRKDHNGLRILDPANPGHTNFTAPSYQGDWVWDFPAN